jgi:hypothetical protein
MPSTMKRGYSEVEDTTFGVNNTSYSPNKGEILYPKSLKSFGIRNFYKVVNLNTGATIYEAGNINYGGNLTKNKNGTLTLNFNTSIDTGTSSDSIKSYYAVPTANLSSSVREAIESVQQKRQSEALESISASSNISVGNLGFKVITDAMGTIVADFGSIFILQGGTRLSTSCTTEYGSDSNLSNYTFEQGTIIPAPWTAIRLETGALLAYYR